MTDLPTASPATTDGRSPNIVLTGFMGTGKSTVARELATRTGRRAIDTDDLIERLHGPIKALFADHGEAHFRALERSVARELGGERGLVISTGGGMLLDPANVIELTAGGRVFCLTASVDALLDRLLADDAVERPLLAGPDPRAAIRDLLAARADAYAAFEQVDTTWLTAAEVAESILGRLHA
ncbi:MAG: AAA family ATPase [Ilumatobacter sp.]|nr:AAA family ATPase [Ilumatobacter sp.]